MCEHWALTLHPPPRAGPGEMRLWSSLRGPADSIGTKCKEEPHEKQCCLRPVTRGSPVTRGQPRVVSCQHGKSWHCSVTGGRKCIIPTCLASLKCEPSYFLTSPRETKSLYLCGTISSASSPPPACTCKSCLFPASWPPCRPVRPSVFLPSLLALAGLASGRPTDPAGPSNAPAQGLPSRPGGLEPSCGQRHPVAESHRRALPQALGNL